MILYDCILNEMNVDELRNYAHHMNEVDERRGQLVFSQSEVIDAYKRLVSCEQYRVESLRALNREQDECDLFAREMEQKYDYAMPRPACDSCTRQTEPPREVQE